MSQVSIQDLVYRGRLSSRTKSLRIELSFCWWWVCSFGLVWVRLRFIYFSRSLHFVKNHRFDPTSKKFPIAPILFNSAKSVTSLWMSSCIPNNLSTRLWLLTLAGWVRNPTKITSNGFPKAVGDGFWPSWGGLLGHLGGLGKGFWVTLLSKGPQDRNRHQKCESWPLPGVPKGTPKWQFSHEHLIKIRQKSSVNECCKHS